MEVARKRKTHLAKLLYLTDVGQACQLGEVRFIEKKRVLVQLVLVALQNVAVVT